MARLLLSSIATTAAVQPAVLGRSLQQPTVTASSPPSLFCYSLVAPSEFELLHAHRLLGSGVFSCDEWALFSNSSNISQGLRAHKVVDGPMTVPVGGMRNSSLNTPLFLNIWRGLPSLLASSGRTFDWIVKLDQDTCFSASRFHELVHRHAAGAAPQHESIVFSPGVLKRVSAQDFKLTQSNWIAGPVEALSVAGVRALAGALSDCTEQLPPEEFGEDIWLAGCIDSGLFPTSWRVIHDKDVVCWTGINFSDNRTSAWLSDWAVTYHPLKDVDDQMACSRSVLSDSSAMAAPVAATAAAALGSSHEHGGALAPTATSPCITIGVATRSRPEWTSPSELPLINTLLSSVLNTTTPSTRLRLRIGYDSDDPFWNSTVRRDAAYRRITSIAATHDLSVVATPMQGTSGKPCWVWSQLFRDSCEEGCEYFLQIGDDVAITHFGWANMFVEALANNRFLPNFGVAGPLDKTFLDEQDQWYRKGAPPMLTQSFTHCTHLNIFGGLYPEEFANWYSDDWISQVYGHRNTFAMKDVNIANSVTDGEQRYKIQYEARSLLKPKIYEGRANISSWLRTKLPTRVEYGAQLDESDAPWLMPDVWFMHPNSSSGADKASSVTATATLTNGSTTLPSLDCVGVVSTTTSTVVDELADELMAHGLWSRTYVVRGERDHDNPVRGVFNGHTEAWRYARTHGCRNMLVLEDDVTFEAATSGAGFDTAEAMLASGAPYDLLMLGWYSPVGADEVAYHRQVTTERTAIECVHTIHDWVTQHAYIISGDALTLWSNLSYVDAVDADAREGTAYHGAIDEELPRRHDRGRFFAVRPMFANQRFHSSSNRWANVSPDEQERTEMLLANTTYLHGEVERVGYANLTAAEWRACSADDGPADAEPPERLLERVGAGELIHLAGGFIDERGVVRSRSGVATASGGCGEPAGADSPEDYEEDGSTGSVAPLQMATESELADRSVAVVRARWSSSFYHLLVSVLPRVGVVMASTSQSLTRNGSALLLVDCLGYHYNTANIADAVQMLGVPLSSVRCRPPGVALRGMRKILLPADAPCGDVDAKVAHRFRTTVLPTWLRQPPPPDAAATSEPRTLILHRRHGARELTNHDQLLERVRAEFAPTFRIVVHEGKGSLHEQLKPFHRAACQVGPHGGGLSMMLFAPDDFGTAEVTPKQYHLSNGTVAPNACFRTLALRLEQRHEWSLVENATESSTMTPDVDEVMAIAHEMCV